MNFKTLTIIFLTTVTFSCNNTTKTPKVVESSIEQLTETPEVFQETSSNEDYRISSFSKRYDSDIITKLYQEAIEKDSKLKKLNENLNKIANIKNDSTLEYSDFKKTNENYWNAVNGYINRMHDSILQESTREIFKKLEQSYLKGMTPYENKIALINQKTINLNDQLILMKLIITLNMMKNYQTNEKPNIESLTNLINEYNKLIKLTEDYSKIK
tara:strand:- start:32 stop:673 length:642 start_codon:yes stop_codon:yes gene_type:complete